MTVTRFHDLPLASSERPWNKEAAERRVRTWAGAQHKPNAKYREAHLWYDGEDPDEFGSYKLPFADVVDGELKAVPHALHAAAGVMDGARGGIDVPGGDVGPIKSHLAKYYDKMHETPPWEG
ncbi:hypothetical protein [Streptosporangium saharense]|uniref:hypothetical protein n=1 Tax=Streptosporangium saharense TaxID=1706840 RepID=UPI003413EEA9